MKSIRPALRLVFFVTMHISTQINTVPYLGSKFSILPWLLPLLPRTKSWVEVFGGSMVVTINREPMQIETYNDINASLVNFFRVLRDQPDELITKLYLTPHSRQEYEESWFDPNDTPLEMARKFFVRMRQSVMATGSQNQKKGWLSATRETRCKISEATNKYLRSVDGLHQIVERLKMIQIENKSFDVILDYYNTPETLFYLDPPYDVEKRSAGSDYQYDFTEEDHYKLHQCLLQVTGKFAISGYDSEFMKKLYKDFYLVPGPVRKNNKSKREVRECLWTNYDPTKIKGNMLF